MKSGATGFFGEGVKVEINRLTASDMSVRYKTPIEGKGAVRHVSSISTNLRLISNQATNHSFTHSLTHSFAIRAWSLNFTPRD